MWSLRGYFHVASERGFQIPYSVVGMEGRKGNRYGRRGLRVEACASLIALRFLGKTQDGRDSVVLGARISGKMQVSARQY
jgi:hypothetical protein